MIFGHYLTCPGQNITVVKLIFRNCRQEAHTGYTSSTRNRSIQASSITSHANTWGARMS